MFCCTVKTADTQDYNDMENTWCNWDLALVTGFYHQHIIKLPQLSKATKHIPAFLFFLVVYDGIRSLETGALTIYFTWFVLSLGFSHAKSNKSHAPEAPADHWGAGDTRVLQGLAPCSKAGPHCSVVSPETAVVFPRQNYHLFCLCASLGVLFPPFCRRTCIQNHSLCYFISMQPNSSSVRSLQTEALVGDPKLSPTSAACLRWLGGASPSSAPPQGWWGRRTAKSAWREFSLDLAENLKQTFPEKRAGESHKSTHTAWPPAVPVQPCPRSKRCPEPRRQPSRHLLSPSGWECCACSPFIATAPPAGRAQPIVSQSGRGGALWLRGKRPRACPPWGCPFPGHRQSQKIPAKI